MPPFAIVNNRGIYHWLESFYMPIGIGVVALFTLVIVVAVIVYRRNDRPSRRHENNRAEASYAILLACVAAFLLYLTFTAEHRVDDAQAYERPAVSIDVIGSRWEWTFRYPRYGITNESGAVGRQPLVLPVNEPVAFHISSDDVIHSFWIPEVYFKRDAMPHHTETVDLDFDQRGNFSGSCAEFCGLLHSEMVFPVHVISDAAFRAWAASGGRTTPWKRDT